ncbi:hypothetical protein KI809_16930 [Geobacter pelophilus]|uniref:Uncharacterized protein n=1 Tax=Geoanaerobacter pelophilus TaxID=60036 RepID=A0AAW4L526_9BACT|nr:hypothetical protein [Geoanaerobacter pelophilus]MBT0665998.1 hypothetical protein [Geoanaerobacter pelophilus]
MTDNETLTTADNTAEAPLERCVAGRYAQLSPLSRSAEILSRGESLCTMAESRGTLAAEIFGRWGREATGAREQLPFVAGVTRCGAEQDSAPVAEEPSEVDRSATPQVFGLLPRLRARQDAAASGGSELSLSAAGVRSPAVGPAGNIKRAAASAVLSKLQTVSPEEPRAVSPPVTPDVITNLEEAPHHSNAPLGQGAPLVAPRSGASRSDSSPLAAEMAVKNAPKMAAAASQSPLSGDTVPVAEAGGSSRLVPVVTRLPERPETAELPLTGAPGCVSAKTGESVSLESFPGQAGHGKRPVLLRKLAPGGSEGVRDGDTPAALPIGTSRQVNNSGQASSQFPPVIGRDGAGLEPVKGIDSHELPVITIARSQGSQVAAAQPVQLMAETPSPSFGSEMARRMTGNRRQPEVTAVEGSIAGAAGVPLSAASLPLGIGRRAAAAPAAVMAEAPHGLVQQSSAADMYPVSGQLAAMPALNRSPEQQPATAATVSAPAADTTTPSRQTGLSREELSQLADQVYTVIEQRLTIEKERRGL